MTKTSPRNVALFGGSFNPPHICHTLATLWVLQTQPIDEVWWIPTFEHAFSKDLVDFSDRMEMCKEATSDLQNVRINSIEKELGGESRTIDTVQALRGEHPDRAFWLMVGADILEETSRWKDWDGLMELVHLIVVGRRGYDRIEATDGGCRVIESWTDQRPSAAARILGPLSGVSDRAEHNRAGMEETLRRLAEVAESEEADRR